MDAWAKLCEIFLVVKAEQATSMEEVVLFCTTVSQPSLLLFFFLSEDVMLLVTREALLAYRSIASIALTQVKYDDYPVSISPRKKFCFVFIIRIIWFVRSFVPSDAPLALETCL